MSGCPILVTGASGWLGRRLVEVLTGGLPDVPDFAVPDRARTIRCLVLPGEDSGALRAGGERVTCVEGDLTRPETLEAFFSGAAGATVFHCAGLIHPRWRVRDFWRVNTDGTRNIVQTAQRAKVRRLIHVSSNSPVGVNPQPDHVFDESSPCRPYLGYGKSKKRAEEIVNEAFGRGDLETVIIRPPWFYGPCQPHRQTLFFSMIKDGKGPLVGGGLNRRSMAYVDNICQGLLLCEKVESAAGQTYWIADREPYTMVAIIDTIERLLEEEFAIPVSHGRLHLPGIAGEFAMWVDTILQGIGLYHQKVHVLGELNKTIACSVKKAETELGYDPKIGLEEGMRRSIRWILDAGMRI